MGRTAVVGWALAALAALGCSLLVNQGASQCATTADCARFTGTQCVQGACATVTIPFDAAIDPAQPCTSTQDCLSLHGTNWVCRKAQCQALGSADCGIVIGNYTADDVLLLGAILPIYGAHKSTGLPMERALAFAADEDFAGGVPFGLGGVKRPVAVVLCDESGNPVRAAQHLAEEIGVPAILGPAFGDSYVAVEQGVALTDHVLLMSPYAVADLTGLADAGDARLEWRTAPTSAGEGAALAGLVSSVVAPKVEATGVDRVALSVVWRSDVDGASLHDSFVSALTLNGFPPGADVNAGLFTDVPYPDTDAPTGLAATGVTGAAPLPNVIVVLGRTEGVTEIIEGIENAWQTLNAPYPYYLVSHGLQVEELLTLAASLPSLRTRILSTSAGDSPTANAALRELLVRYTNIYADYPAQTSGVAQTFDAFYLLAYGLAAVRNTDVVGLDERDGLEKVLFGGGTPHPVTVGPEDIETALTLIADSDAGSTIALAGTSGSLAYVPDAAPYTPPSDVQVSCVALASGTGAPTFMPTGIAWSAAAGALTGTVTGDCLP